MNQWETKAKKGTWKRDERKHNSRPELNYKNIANLVIHDKYKSHSSIGRYFGTSPTHIVRCLKKMASQMMMSQLQDDPRTWTEEDLRDGVNHVYDQIGGAFPTYTAAEKIENRKQMNAVWVGEDLAQRLKIKFL